MYRHIPLTPERPKRKRAGAIVYWTFFWLIGVSLFVGLTLVQPFSIFLSIPFLIGYASKRRRKESNTEEYPYDSA